MYLFEKNRKTQSSIKYIGTVARGVMANMSELAKIRGTVMKRYRIVPRAVSNKGGSLIPLVLIFFTGS